MNRVTHRPIRLLLATLLTLSALVAIGTSTVVAQAPDNDSVQSPVEITGVGFHYEQDTSEATADPADGGCGVDQDLATVWFRFTPQDNVTVLFDTSASDYSNGVNLYVEEGGNLINIACSFPPLFAELSGGVTYFVMVAACCEGVNGGTLVLDVTEAPPPPELSLTINSAGSVRSSTGEVTISGTLDCSTSASAFVSVDIQQRKGRSIIQGNGFTDLLCEGETPWSLTLTGFNGLFTAGKVQVQAFVQACTFVCTFTEGSANVQLKGKK
jgi:hypothetical protein